MSTHGKGSVKIAILLFQLGSPANLKDVRRFLYSMFSDPSILPLPTPLRQVVACIITCVRTKTSQALYRHLGGVSPLLSTTEKQACALEKELGDLGDVRCFVAMRYSHPSITDAVKAAKRFNPDIILQLPLYPQYSTATTGSCLRITKKLFRKEKRVITIDSYHDDPGFIAALAETTRAIYDESKKFGRPRVLFSAHGLPQRVIDRGDPYSDQCALTVAALKKALNIPNLDSVLCYQSRLGPLKWTGPSTHNEINRAARSHKPIIVVPLSFVADNLETVVEMALEERQRALILGAPSFTCVPPVGISPAFIGGLAKRLRSELKRKQ